jgi:hypothetical protein
MKVRCIKLLNSDKLPVKTSPWLRLDKEYYVMSIRISLENEKKYTIISNDTDPGFVTMGLHHSECFEITSTKTPSNWNTQISLDGSITISPRSWQTPGFLERFYDCDKGAYEIFEHERDLIIKEDP